MNRLMLLSCCALAGCANLRGPGALQSKLDIQQQTFHTGDTVSVRGNLFNGHSRTVKGTIECQIERQTNLDDNRLSVRSFALRPGKGETYPLYSIYVEDDFPSDQYNVTLRVLVDGVIHDVRTKSFSVEGTLKQLGLKVDLYADQECERKAKVFVPGETIHVSFTASAEDALATAELHSPQGPLRRISLPTQLHLEEPGPYTLDVSAAAHGYTRDTACLHFAVIERTPRISGPNEQ